MKSLVLMHKFNFIKKKPSDIDEIHFYSTIATLKVRTSNRRRRRILLFFRVCNAVFLFVFSLFGISNFYFQASRFL